MRKVLIIFPYSHHESLIAGQCNYLNEHGFSADSLLFVSSRLVLYNYSKIRLPLKFRIIYHLYSRFRKTPIYYWLSINHFVRRTILKTCFHYYDIIEFAGTYDPQILDYAKYVHTIGKELFVRLWGSDFYRIITPQHDWHKVLFDLASKVFVASTKMYDDFTLLFPSQQGKLEIQSYGLTQLELLKDILDGKIAKDTSFLDERAFDKIIISIGYNGRTWQQHFYVLDAISNLPRKQKDKLFLVFPMTYCTNNEYIDYIKSRLDQLDIPYQILSDRLSLVQNMSLRIISNIAICIQQTDALAASVQEYLMAGSVFIAGDWLPYNMLLEYGLYFHPTSLFSLFETLKHVIGNLEEEMFRCQNNREIIYNFSSWRRKMSYLNSYVQV